LTRQIGNYSKHFNYGIIVVGQQVFHQNLIG
jgi:hypothetical protein